MEQDSTVHHANTLPMQNSLPTDGAILDLRTTDQYTKLHLKNSCAFPWDAREDNMYLLPPKGSELAVIVVRNISEQVVKDYFLKGEYVVRWLCTENDQMWEDIRRRGLDEYGIRSARLWRPNPFLLQLLDEKRLPIGKDTVAIDLACGCGRDLVLFASRGCRAIGIDRDLVLLKKVAELAEREGVSVETLSIDMECETGEAQLKPLRADIVHVARYLHRELFPIITNMIRPGGYLVYHTFLKGAEKFGAPRKARFLLNPDELRMAFTNAFEILEYREATIEDGRPVAFLFARKK